jgi:hypothetical protein
MTPKEKAKELVDKHKMADAVEGYKEYYEFGKAHLKDKL